jgi:hypothetical protein
LNQIETEAHQTNLTRTELTAHRPAITHLASTQA